jgi:hypothetical protein
MICHQAPGPACRTPQAVQAFAGADHTAPVLPPAALRLLRSYDTESQHYHLAAHHEQPDD